MLVQPGAVDGVHSSAASTVGHVRAHRKRFECVGQERIGAILEDMDSETVGVGGLGSEFLPMPSPPARLSQPFQSPGRAGAGELCYTSQQEGPPGRGAMPGPNGPLKKVPSKAKAMPGGGRGSSRGRDASVGNAGSRGSRGSRGSGGSRG
eukprot:5967141-Alexandrium_andersonii.AAC.1